MRMVEVAGEVFEVRLHRDAEDSYRGRVNGREIWLEARRTPAGSWLLVREGRVVEAFVEGDGDLRVHLPGLEVPVRIRDPLRQALDPAHPWPAKNPHSSKGSKEHGEDEHP